MSAMTKTPIDARRAGRWSAALSEALQRAVAGYDFSNSVYFAPLADLSGSTEFDGLDVDTDSIVVAGRAWSAAGTVYVTLVYDPNSNEPVRMTDSYPVVVHFSIDGDDVTIQKIEVDVQSFYE